MARLGRGDGAGTWHHVMNRGLARRTVFESELDVRRFLAELARAVRAGWIEVHAFCLLTTHFHLLLRSPEGELSTAMRAVQNEYVRWFNRGRGRDGSLFRGRFRSRRIDSLAYRRQLVRYIDFNPVLAGLVDAPGRYPHASARRFASERGPPWLARWWIEETVCATAGLERYQPERYAECFGRRPEPGLARVVERRIAQRTQGADPLDDLLAAAPEHVLSWMRERAKLADGTPIDAPVCDAQDVATLLAAARVERAQWRLWLSRRSVDAWELIEIGLLRQLCASSGPEIAARLARTPAGVAKGYRHHLRALHEDAEYAHTAAHLASAAIAAANS